MRSKPSFVAALVAGATALAPSALAHVSVSGPATAGQSQILTFGVGHGCAGADTYRVEVEIPEAVQSVRALPGPFGEPELTRDDTGRVVAVAWEKATVRDADDAYYEFGLRVGVPNAPFTRLYFKTTQWCRTPDGEERTAAWVGTPEEIAQAPAGEAPEPAPALLILPPRAPGWNQFTAPAALDPTLFSDAQIVWVGQAAYSANPHTMALIRAEADVDELTAIPAGAEIWVKY